MGDASVYNGVGRRTIISTRKIVHISMLSFALLLPFLTWVEAAGAALVATALTHLGRLHHGQQRPLQRNA